MPGDGLIEEHEGRTRIPLHPAGRVCAEPGPGADCLQRPLVPRSRFRQQLRPGVRRQL